MLLDSGLRRSVRLWGDKVAAIDGDTRRTYAEFGARVDRLANALRDLGLARGDRVGILMLNTYRYLELYYAVNIAGGVVVPLNHRLAVPELAFILDDCACTMLFITREFVGQAEQLRGQCPALVATILAEDEPAPAGLLAYEALLAAANPTRPQVALAETDLAGIFYTGGTTGRPKGAMLSQRNLVDNAYRMIMEVGYRDDDVYLHAAPMFHLADGASTFAITYVGGTHAHIRAFQPQAVLETIARDRVTSAVLVPTMITALLNHPAIGQHDLASLRRLGYGASPIATGTLRLAMELLPCQFFQAYGMTEAAPILTVLPPADHRLEGSQRALRRLASAGRASIGIELRVVDDEDRDVPTNAIGEVIARGANIMVGYWNRPQETAEALRDGWYHSGDLAMLDEDGYLSIVDRKKDMIVTGGENVYSVEVENALYSHPAVLECAVIGVPDARWGEAVLAVVVRKPGQDATETDLIAHCHTRIAGYKAPKSVAFTDLLPKSGAGKILKRELREQHWAGEERRVH